MPRWMGLSLAIALLTACSGGASGVLPKTSVQTPAKAKVNVTITMRVPGAASARTAALRRIFTIAQNTAGAQVQVLSAGDDSGTPLASTAANIEPSTSSGSTCAASDSYGNRTCSFSVTAPAGTDDFIITTWDQAPPAGGTIPGGAEQLGWGIDPSVAIVAGAAASVSATLSSVLASVSLDLTPAALHQLIPSTGTIGVYALDADNDVIVSNGFVDPSGNPITLSFAVDNNLYGALTLSTGSITAPSATGVQYTYAPSGVLNTSGTFNVNVSVSSSYAGVASASVPLSAIYPSFTSITDGNLSALNSYHGGIAFDTSGGVYYSFDKNFGGIDYYAGSGSSATTLYNGTATNPVRGGISTGYTGSPNQLLSLAGSLTLAGTINGASTSLATVGPSVPLANGSAMASVTNGNVTTLWYASGTTLAALDTQTFTYQTYAGFDDTPTAGVVADASGNIWVVDNVANGLYECPAGCSSLAGPYSLNSGPPFDVLANSNGIFVTQVNSSNPMIMEINPASPASGPAILTLPSNATPYYLMPDNAQPGIVWFDYMLYGQIGIGRMDTNVSPANIVMATDVNGPFGSQAGAIGTASNGLVYMVFDGTSTLVQVSR